MRLSGSDLSLEAGVRREWLLANGVGGFASGTVLGANTRRYHGLLIAALHPPADRHLLISQVEDVVTAAGGRYSLSTNFYPGAVHPEGYRLLVTFELDPGPRWTFAVGPSLVERELYLVAGENTAVLRYLLHGSDPASLRVAPLVNYRFYHHTNHERGWPFWQDPGERWVRLQPHDGASWSYLYASTGSYRPGGTWYRSMVYPVERERGLDHLEDHYNPGYFQLDLLPGRPVYLWFSDQPRGDLDVAALRPRAAAAGRHDRHDSRIATLLGNTAAFVVERQHGAGKTLLAGYHWFSDWGRDAFIALPGVCLIPGRLDDAASILATFAGARHRGLVPNRFSDTAGKTEYNTVDASLWLFYAVHKYLQYGGDRALVRRELYPALVDIVAWYRRGTAYGIHAAADGLVQYDGEGLQLTWMDAKHGEEAFTPRSGKPVEVNALWYNALCTTAALARDFGDGDADAYLALSRRVEKSFDQFWCGRCGYLGDVLGGEGTDWSLRPNQLLAVALPYPVVRGERARQVVAACSRMLLTPYGLRTLAPDHRDYHGRYQGGPDERDRAYHQGTVWPWLLGPYITALVRSQGDGGREWAARWLEPLLDHLGDAGLGFVSELFDGDPPHRPGGCIAQAWSAGEVLRAYYEDVLGENRLEPITDRRGKSCGY